MNKRFYLCVFAAAVFVTIVSCRLFGGEQGNIVYQASDRDGKPAPELVVLDAGGEELRRIEVPDDVGALYPFHFPLSRHVLYEDAIVTGKWFLVDVTSGELQEFDGLGRGQDRAWPCAFSSDRVLLRGSEGVYLLDVAAGEVLDVPIELDPTSPVPPLVELVSPDEAYFLVRVSGDLWLVPAAAPETTRRLGLERGASHATLSEDNEFVAYTERTEEGETQVVKETIEGSDTEIILSEPDITRAAFVPKHNQLVIIRRKSVSLLSLDDQEEHELFEPVDVVRELWFDPDGTKAAFGAGGLRVAEVEWTYVDLEKRTEEALDELEGYRRVYGRASSRWLFLADDYPQGEARIASLDMETEEVRTHVTLEDAIAFDFVGLTEDGRVGLVIAFLEEETQIWLLLAEQDDAVLLAESRAASGSLSPDGEWVALSVREESDEVTMTIKLVATDSGEEQVIGEGFMPVWAKP
jgi:hypothetical protein